MGNCYSNQQKYKNFLNDNEFNEKEVDNKILIINQYIEQLENKQKLNERKLIDLQNQNNKLEQKITIITNDMQSLLNNDKLLLEKMIEKKMLSTIEES
jgi:hypothetical protein